MHDNDNIIDDGNRLDANGRVIAQDNHLSEDPDYMEIGDRERIIDDNARRSSDTTHLTNDQVIKQEEHVIHANSNNLNKDNYTMENNMINDHDGIDRTAVKHMSDETKKDLNADMITGEPGSHPVGTGIGSIGGAAAGAAIGTMAGPLGTLIGGAIGAIVGGGAGHAAAEAIDPTREEAYWRAEYSNADYYKEGYEFDRDLHPAYAVGYANRARYPADSRFEDHEADLERSWHEVKGESRMAWDDARMASRDAWNRVT